MVITGAAGLRAWVFSGNCRASAGSSSSRRGYRGARRCRRTRENASGARPVPVDPARAGYSYPDGISVSRGHYTPLNDQRCCSIYPITFGTYLINELFKLNR